MTKSNCTLLIVLFHKFLVITIDANKNRVVKEKRMEKQHAIGFSFLLTFSIC
jgi:hypothetical protein